LTVARTSPDPAQRYKLAQQIPQDMNDLVPKDQIILAYRAPTELRKQLPGLLAQARAKGKRLLLLRLLCLSANDPARKAQIASLEVELRSLIAMLQNQQELISVMIFPCATLDQLFAFAVRHRAAQLILTDDLIQAFA
jgi:hypothetical protein